MNPTNRPARTPRAAFNLAAIIGARQRRRALVGFLLILGALTLALLIFLLDPLLEALRDDAELVALFDSAPNVAPGAAVWIAGHEVGEVRSLEFLPLAGPQDTSRLALVLVLPRDQLRHVRADASVRLTSASLIGEPAVDIRPGSAAAPPVQPGDTLRAEPLLTSAAVRARAAAVRAGLDSLVQETGPLAGHARARMAVIARVQEGFAGTQRELDALAHTLATSPAAAAAGDVEVQRALERLRAAAGVVGSATAPGSGPARAMTAFQPLARHTSELSARLDSLRLRGTPNGTLVRLQNDSALAVALRRARAELDSLIADAKRRPFRYVF